jgi:ATP-binding cassette, subfamily B, bacterial
MQLLELTPLQAFRRSVVTVIRAAPLELSNLVILTLLAGIAPTAVLWLNKVIIDQAIHFLRYGTAKNVMALIVSQPILLQAIVGLLLINLLSESINTIASFVLTSLRDRVKGYIEGQVLYKVANFEDIALFENPELLNILNLAEQGIHKLQQLFLLISQALQGIFILIPAVLLVQSIAWWIPLILLSSTAPGIYESLNYRKQCWRVEKNQVSTTRELNLYKSMLIGEVYAKELRLFHLQSLLLDRWHGLFIGMLNTMETIRRQGTIVIIAWSLLSGLGTAFPYFYTVFGVFEGTYTLGDLALYSGVILQVRRSLTTLINAGSDLYDLALGTSPIFQLLELQPQICNSLNQSQKISNSLQTGIQIQHLSFTYPNSNSPTLKDINLTIYPNEMIALVGENGAGKTTLAKLLCRFYDPDTGAIFWNGQDLRSQNLEDLRSQITVVMQDYARFPTTVRENVAFGALSKLQDDSAIQQAIAKVGMTQAVKQFEQKLETRLGKQLEGGVDLSGGQWQKLAIARALIRLPQSKLVVFDEPTANLDPKTEHEVYKLFHTLAVGRITIVVSHRLALAKLADRVVVVENGKIIEVGHHEELMALKGRYHSMFTRQASSYQ